MYEGIESVPSFEKKSTLEIQKGKKNSQISLPQCVV